MGRKGKAKPGTSQLRAPIGGKPTAEELEERIEYTAALLAWRKTKTQIRRALNEKYGVARATADRYVSRARELMGGKTIQQYRAESIEFWEELIRSENVSIECKIKAQRELDRLAGRTPTRVSFTDADGNTLGRGEIEAQIAALAEGIAES